MQDTIGSDISKDTLDCFQLSSSKHCQYRNGKQGHKALIKWLKSQGATLVVFEATGKLAKTDRVDAAMLAKMGAVLDLPAQEPKSENINILTELLTARHVLKKDNAAAKIRSHTTLHAVFKMQIGARQKQITLQLKQIDKIIAKMIDGNEELSRKFEILLSIPSIAGNGILYAHRNA